MLCCTPERLSGLLRLPGSTKIGFCNNCVLTADGVGIVVSEESMSSGEPAATHGSNSSWTAAARAAPRMTDPSDVLDAVVAHFNVITYHFLRKFLSRCGQEAVAALLEDVQTFRECSFA